MLGNLSPNTKSPAGGGVQDSYTKSASHSTTPAKHLMVVSLPASGVGYCLAVHCGGALMCRHKYLVLSLQCHLGILLSRGASGIMPPRNGRT